MRVLLNIYIYGGEGRGRETVREGEKEGKGVWKKTNINVNRAFVASYLV